MSSKTKSSTEPIQQASIDWREADTPVSVEFDDPYYSLENGLEESEYVFLSGNHLADRLKRQSNFTIGETGFGTGLNFLCAWQLRDQVNPDCRLHYISFEKFPLSKTDLEQALRRWSDLEYYSDKLLNYYPFATPGWHRVSFYAANVELSLYIGDVKDGLLDYTQSGHRDGTAYSAVQAWFLDGFAPAKNPHMWTSEISAEIAKLSAKDTTFSTFTAASAVRENLRQAGFEVSKVKGFGKKRHMLTGRFTGTPASENPVTSKPWFVRPQTKVEEKKAVVIGAGLAGCSAAFSLARRGWQVSLIDKHASLAAEASGNKQGVLYAKLSAEPSARSDFYTAGYQYSLNTLKQKCEAGENSDWNPTGVLQLAKSAEEADRQRRFLSRNPQPQELVFGVASDEASQIAGINIDAGGLYFPAAGWVQPERLCAQLAEHTNITLITGADISAVQQQNSAWLILDSEGEAIAHSSIVVMATARAANDFQATQHLPLKSIRGQVSQIPAPQDTTLKTVVCADSYVAPAIDGHLHFGATFDLVSEETASLVEDHQKNLAATRSLIPALEHHLKQFVEDTTAVRGRVGFRCTTPDYMPIVGPVADFEAFTSQYAQLRKDAKTGFSEPGKFLPGLFATLGHGSKGLTSCPLAGEILAAYICNEPMPVETRLLEAVHPARFIIRDLIRNRI